MTVSFPYGKNTLTYDFTDAHVRAVLRSHIEEVTHPASFDDEVTLVREAMAHPIGSPTLAELARGKKRITLIASDHTRPVPSRVIVPLMLDEIRSTAPDAEITILIATGCHRGTKKEELEAKFGGDTVANEHIVVHDCDDRANLVSIGTLPSGGDCVINRIAAEADLLVAEGFIEPHFFAGFSGGRKSVLPGVAARETVLANHCSEFIASPHARTGILGDNPIHRDMLWAAKTAGLAYIVNVVLDSEKRVVHAVAGDCEKAHLAGCEYLSHLCQVDAVPADIVVTTNGGYPLDQNVYQSVKGMTAAEATVREGGVIVMLASCADGIGGENFRRQLAEEKDISVTMARFLARDRGETVPDQWQTQILLRVLSRASVILVSEMDDCAVRTLHMTPAHSIAEAMDIAYGMVGSEADVTLIPDGVGVMVR